MWQALIGKFEFSARFFVSMSLTPIFLYVIYSLFNIQRVEAAQLVECCVGKLWDLGSIPRSPSFSILFFSSGLRAVFPSKAYHALYAPARHLSHNVHPVARIQGLWYASVKRATHVPEKSTRPGIKWA